MATVKRRGAGYWVRWQEPIVTIDGSGQERKRWQDRSRTFPSREAAEEFAAEVTIKQKRGERVVDERLFASATLGTVADAYVAAVSNAPVATRRFRQSMMNAFLGWSGRDRPVSELTVGLLDRYATSLPVDGRAAATRHRKVLEVERMWAWARDRGDRYPGVPEVRSITGTDADAVRPPPPVVRVAVPTWDEVDRMIGSLRPGWKHGQVHRRVAVLLRYTGLRVSQALHLRWADVQLDHPAGPHVVVRRGTPGAKSSRGRVIPLHPALSSELATWGVREGWVFEPRSPGFVRGDATRDAFATAWRAADVHPDKWGLPSVDDDAPGKRAHGSPCHSIRAALHTGLLRAGVHKYVADYFVGHSGGATTEAYVPEAAPDTSPMWPMLLEAVAKIPAIGSAGR